MKTILAICLLTATVGLIPSAEASTVCDPATGQACAGSYTYGTCDNGGSGNFVSYYSYDENGYTAVSASTYCYGYPGYYSVSGISAGATSCDPSWNCDYAGAYWDGGNFFGSSFCGSMAYAYVDGQYQSQALPLCETAGAPPAVPALLP